MHRTLALIIALTLLAALPAAAKINQQDIYPTQHLKPVDSSLKVQVGDQAPDFTLPSVRHGEITLSDYRGKKNVVLSFVPAAFTPVCSDQWPGYNIMKELFEQHDAVLLGITVDNVPSLFAWTNQMGGLWFPVLSDFYAHGAVAIKYGILRGDGVTERAIFVIDKQGVIRYINVNDINLRPDAGAIINALQKLND